MKISTSTSRLSYVLILLVTGVLALQRAEAVDALLLQDTYVDSSKNAAADNFGLAGDLKVSKSANASTRAFLKFSTDTLPPGTTAADIKQARLRLWVNASSTTLGSITLTPVTSAWSELTLTNSTSSTIAVGAPKHADLPIGFVGQFVSIDISDWVQAWLAGTLSNQGFEIEPSAASQSLSLYFDSKESVQTSHEPRLEITLIGPAGPAGPQGSPGPQGPAGVQGVAGATGPVGPPGAQGPIGPAGQVGAGGPQGAVGPTGEAGPAGSQGIPGESGSKWYSSNGVPQATLGAPGDYYLDVDSGDVWHKTTNGGAISWSKQANLRGTDGPPGAVGAQGLQGVPGIPGVPGQVGPAGAQGPTGSTGLTGPPGPAGAPGPAGTQGPSGTWPARVGPQGDLSMGDFTQGPTP